MFKYLARAVSRAVLPGLYRAGYRIAKAVETLEKRGYGYAEHRMRQDTVQIYSRLEKETPVRRWPKDTTPSKDIISEVELRQPERTYRIFGEVDYYDWEERKWKKHNISFYDDYLRSKEDWENKFVQDFADPYFKMYNQTIYGVNIFSIEHNKGHLY